MENVVTLMFYLTKNFFYVYLTSLCEFTSYTLHRITSINEIVYFSSLKKTQSKFLKYICINVTKRHKTVTEFLYFTKPNCFEIVTYVLRTKREVLLLERKCINVNVH